jgi:hypothetical protein
MAEGIVFHEPLVSPHLLELPEIVSSRATLVVPLDDGRVGCAHSVQAKTHEACQDDGSCGEQCLPCGPPAVPHHRPLAVEGEDC